MLISELNLIEFIQKKYHKLPNLSFSYLNKRKVGNNTKETQIESVFLFILFSILSK